MTEYERELLLERGFELKAEFDVSDLTAVKDESGNIIKPRLGNNKRAVQRLLTLDQESKDYKKLKALKRGQKYYVLRPNLVAFLQGQKQYAPADPQIIAEITEILLDKDISPTQYFTDLLNELKQNNAQN